LVCGAGCGAFGGNSLIDVCGWLCVRQCSSVSERLWQPGFGFCGNLVVVVRDVSPLGNHPLAVGIGLFRCRARSGWVCADIADRAVRSLRSNELAERWSKDKPSAALRCLRWLAPQVNRASAIRVLLTVASSGALTSVFGLAWQQARFCPLSYSDGVVNVLLRSGRACRASLV
jgi:hypothetical protein